MSSGNLTVKNQHEMIVIRPWPKMIFLWPTMAICLLMGIANWISNDWQDLWGAIFLVVLGLNLMVLTFEFPRATWLTLIIAIVAVVSLLLLLNYHFEVFGWLKTLLINLNINASTHFYFTFFFVQVILFVGMFFVTRFDYWELTPNEFIHHHGILSDVERYSTAGLKLNKEISDVFEYILAGAGRIIAVIPGNPRPIVLENVLNISKIEQNAGRVLDARMVRVERDSGPGRMASDAHQNAADVNRVHDEDLVG